MVKKKQMPVFWKIYVAACAILVIALGVWLVILYGWLGEYESSQPSYYADKVFSEYFSPLDPEKYVDACGLTKESEKTAKYYVDYLTFVTDSREITYNKVTSADDETLKYMVSATGGESNIKFASFELYKKVGDDGETVTYEAGGFEIYTDLETAIAENTFTKYFSSFDASEYFDLCGNDGDFIDSREDIIAYLKAATASGKLTYKRVSEDSDSVIGGPTKYIVFTTDGEKEEKLASFKLFEKDTDGPFKDYEAGEFNIYIDNKTAFTVEAPKGYSVSVNGKVLSDKYIEENDIPTDSCNHMPEGVSGIYYTKYLVTMLDKDPVIEIVSEDGVGVPFEMTEKNTYKASPAYDTELSGEYSEWVLEAAELYARYTQYDEKVNVVGFNKVAPYFDPSSELYESIRTMDNMFVQYYDSFEFTDKTAGEFVMYNKDTFSCRVKLTQLMYSGNDVYDDAIDMTLYVRNVDGEFLIYDMQVNVD